MATNPIRRFFARLAEANTHFSNDDGFMMSAAMAYYLALSFFPLFLILLAGLGVILESTTLGQDVQKQLLAAIEQQASPELSKQVGRALDTIGARAPAGGPIGFITLLAAAVALFAQVDAAFDRIWSTPTSHAMSWWHWIKRQLYTRIKALCMLVAVGGFVIGVMIASMIWTGAQAAMEPRIDISPTLRWVLGLSINLALNLFAFTVIYRFVPKPEVRWLVAARGGAVAAILWEVGRQLLAIYLVRQGLPSAYGIIGSFLAIMLWAYYAMVVTFFGAEYARVVGDEIVGDEIKRRTTKK